MNFIDGTIVGGRGEEYTRYSPATGAELFSFRLANADDVNDAVAAAKRAFKEWRQTTPAVRSELLRKLGDALQAKAAELAETESRETGKALRLAQEFDVPGSIDNTYFFSGAARNLTGLAAGTYWENSTSMIRREPIGVVGSIAPWNYPLQMAAWKVLPALAAGNTIVLKTSEMTPGTTMLFAQAAAEVGFPPGVFNVIVGDGQVAGEALVAHPDVAMTSFTGSTKVGRRIMEVASKKGARVHLELGGKAPLVVFADADVEAAARGAVAGSLINGGQDCTAATRAIVHASVFETFCERVAALMSQVVIGDPSDPATDLGALISPAHRDRVAGFVDRARAAGLQVRCGGEVPNTSTAGENPGAQKTAFYSPTLITGVDRDSKVWKEEIFGPVLVAMPFEDDDEAIELANDTPYGLAASAWTGSTQRALRAASEIEAGCVWINEHIPIVSEMPHGGYKASGFGKDMSAYSFEEYTQIKHVLIDQTEGSTRDWHSIIFTDSAQD